VFEISHELRVINKIPERKPANKDNRMSSDKRRSGMNTWGLYSIKSKLTNPKVKRFLGDLN
jgi:hypothetical protein